MFAGTRLDAFTSHGVRCFPESTLDPCDTVDAFGSVRLVRSVAPRWVIGGVGDCGGVGGQRRLHLLFGAWILRAGVYAQLDKSSTAHVVMGAVCCLVRVAQQELIHPQLAVFFWLRLIAGVFFLIGLVLYLCSFKQRGRVTADVPAAAVAA